jgi:hypothetical protein
MSERLATETPVAEDEVTDEVESIDGVEKTEDNMDRYSHLKIDAGLLGNAYYYSPSRFTILLRTEDELNALNEKFSEIFEEYTDAIIVGTPEETSLILSLNQASANLAQQHEVIEVLREEILKLRGNETELVGATE